MFLNPNTNMNVSFFSIVNRVYVVLVCIIFEAQNKHQRAGRELVRLPPQMKPLFKLLVGHYTKQTDHGLLKMRHLSSAYYSNMYTLSETGNTIENLLKYNPYISWNNKGGRDSPIKQRL